MAVTNVATIQTDQHVRLMAKFALDAVSAASETLVDTENPELGKLTIRVGIHSGPVVASVCGTRNQRFSIIGDTVNIASRMESHSLPRMIQCSAESAMLLKAQAPEIALRPRGVINVKGKGRMKTFWIQTGSDHEYSNIPDPIMEHRYHALTPDLDRINEDRTDEESEATSMSANTFGVA